MLRKEDFIENKEVSDLVHKVCEIDADYVNTESDVIAKKSKALSSEVMFLFDHLQSLARMSMYEKGIILVGMKSLIECFEAE